MRIARGKNIRNMKQLEMELLNPEKLNQIIGGGCTKAGDTLYKKCIKLVGDITIVNCVTYEATCPSGFALCTSGDTSTCKSGFVLKPK